MPGTPKKLAGPLALTNTLTTNVYVPASALVYDVITHIAILNKTAGAVTFSLWLGATGANAAGTEVIGTAKSVPANDTYHWYGRLKVTSTDFLVGGASAATSLSILIEGESYVV